MDLQKEWNGQRPLKFPPTKKHVPSFNQGNILPNCTINEGGNLIQVQMLSTAGTIIQIYHCRPYIFIDEARNTYLLPPKFHTGIRITREMGLHKLLVDTTIVKPRIQRLSLGEYGCIKNNYRPPIMSITTMNKFKIPVKNSVDIPINSNKKKKRLLSQSYATQKPKIYDELDQWEREKLNYICA
jgi:hypothetical protein